MLDYEIRLMKKEEEALLEKFLYQAIFQKEGEKLLPKSIIEEPEIKQYIEEFGEKDDHCLVAVKEGEIIGAVWTRLLAGPIKGFGNIDDDTPELAISVCKEYRGKGIGEELILNVLAVLREKGYKKVSLSVQKDNYAVKLYEKTGFVKIKENGEDYIMVCEV